MPAPKMPSLLLSDLAANRLLPPDGHRGLDGFPLLPTHLVSTVLSAWVATSSIEGGSADLSLWKLGRWLETPHLLSLPPCLMPFSPDWQGYGDPHRTSNTGHPLTGRGTQRPTLPTTKGFLQAQNSGAEAKRVPSKPGGWVIPKAKELGSGALLRAQ